MQVVRKRYFPALAEYIHYGKEASLIQANEIGKQLRGINPETILSLHEDCLQTLAVNVDSNEIVELYNRSFVFLTELIGTSHSLSEVNDLKREMEESSDVRFYEMRELLFRSNQSTEKMKNKYENVLQHMDSGIALFDSDGILTFINVQMAKHLDIPRNRLCGCSVREILLHNGLTLATKKSILRIYREMAVKKNRYIEFQHVDGKHLLATITYGEQLDGGYLISVKDVSEFRQIEQSAYQNEKLAMLGKISAAIAHEIRIPLTSIRGFIQLLRPYLLEIGKEEYARIILTEIDRANDIIHEFLNSSKPSAPMKQKASIEQLLKDIIILIESEALLQNCEIVIDLFAMDLFVSIDVKQLKQVILNMIKNSLDAVNAIQNSRRGKINIYVNSDGKYVEITIKDNGNGMDKLTQSKLFDPFFTTKQTGTGLGLSVSYRIIRNHGGNIRVNSTEGVGTEFIIYLPLHTESIKI